MNEALLPILLLLRHHGVDANTINALLNVIIIMMKELLYTYCLVFTNIIHTDKQTHNTHSSYCYSIVTFVNSNHLSYFRYNLANYRVLKFIQYSV